MTASTRTVAVILFNFAGDQRRPYTPEQAKRILFTGEGSVDAYLRESSFGQTGISGDVFGWYTIPERGSDCRFAQWGKAAQTLAALSGVDLGAFQHRVLVFPTVPECGWAGMAELPGSVAWINGELTTRVVAHELSHNLGVHHASSLRCVANGVRVAIGGECSQAEYGDPFDVMGAGERHTSNWNKARLGWLGDSNRLDVTASGTYTLAAQEQLTPDLQLLRIPRGDGLFYYLELRQPFGSFFDNFALADPAVRGVSIRLAPDYGTTVQSGLIDTTPTTNTFADAPLTPGRTFADPEHGIWILSRSVLGGRATVQIGLGTPPKVAPQTLQKRTRRPHSRGRARARVVRGDGRSDTLRGGPGRDLLLGGRGADLLNGGGGRDSLWGGPGNDTLVARDGGVDQIRCGPGRDTVIADRREAVGAGCEIVKLG